MVKQIVQPKHWVSLCALSLLCLWPGSMVLARTPAPLPQVASAGPPSFADVAERVVTAVVNVTVVTEAPTQNSLSRLLPPGIPENSPLHEFFRRFHHQEAMPFGAPREGQGSGFIIDPQGYIVTNHHVIADADRIEITLNNGDHYTASVVGRDTKTDLALLKIEATVPLPFVELGSAENARVGDWVLAVGNPFGLGGSVNAGIISARGRDIRSGPYDDYLQIDAPINRGNSGGPLFDATGKVIGVNTAIFSPSGGNIGIGFAIPAETVADVVSQLRDTGRVERGWLGVQIQPVTPEVASSLGLEQHQGVLVTQVLPQSPAQRAGLRDGDVIIRVADQAMSDYRQLTRYVATLPAGKKVEIEVLRGSQRQKLAVTIGAMPQSETAQAPMPRRGMPDQDQEPAPARLGVYVHSLTPELRAEFRIPASTRGALVVDVEPGTPAARAGIRPGMVISMVGQQPVNSAEEAIAAIRAAARGQRPAVLLRIEHNDELRFVVVPFSG